MTSRHGPNETPPSPGKTGRILKIVAISFLVVLAIAGTGVYFAVRSIRAVDLRAYLQTQTSALIGRDLAIDGELRLRIFSFQPGILADDVRLSNAAWGSQRDMMRVKRLDAEIDLLALITGTIRIDRFNLLQPEVLVETNRQGLGNWVFEQRRAQPVPAAPHTKRFALDIREVGVVNGHVIFRNGVNGREQRFDLASLNIRSGAAKELLSIDLASTVNDLPVTLTGCVGSLVDFAESRQPLPLQFAAQVGDARVTLTGAVADPLKLAGVDVRVTAEGDEFAETARNFGIVVPAFGRYRLSGRLSGSAHSLAASDVLLVVGDPEHTGARLQGAVRDVFGPVGADFVVSARVAGLKGLPYFTGLTLPAPSVLKLQARVIQSREGYAIRDFAVSLGNSRLSGTAAITRRAPRLKLTAQLGGPLLDLHELIPLPPSGAAPEPSPKDERLFSDKPLSLGWLNAIDLDLNLSIERLMRRNGNELHAVNAHVVLADGKFSLDPLRMMLSPDGNALSVRLRAGATPAGKLDVRATLQGAAIELARLLALADKTAGISGARTDVAFDVHATGGSVRELMAGLNGEARFVVGAGRLDGRTLYLGTNLLTEFFKLANPFSKDETYTELKCAVVRLPVQDGLVTVDRSIALEMSKVNIVASGIIDLRRETIELYASTQARKGLGLSTKVTNMFKIQGALGAPSLGVSGEGALRSSVSVGVAVGTVGLSLLAERLMLEDSHPCRTALGPSPASN